MNSFCCSVFQAVRMRQRQKQAVKASQGVQKSGVLKVLARLKPAGGD